jgi:hypothetical protein
MSLHKRPYTAQATRSLIEGVLQLMGEYTTDQASIEEAIISVAIK